MPAKVARLASSTSTRGVRHTWKWRFKLGLGVSSLLDKFYNGSHTDTSAIQFDIGDICCDGRLPKDFSTLQLAIATLDSVFCKMKHH